MTKTVLIPNVKCFCPTIKQLEKRLAEIKKVEPHAIDTINAYELVLADLKGGGLND